MRTAAWARYDITRPRQSETPRRARLPEPRHQQVRATVDQAHREERRSAGNSIASIMRCALVRLKVVRVSEISD